MIHILVVEDDEKLNRIVLYVSQRQRLSGKGLPGGTGSL